MNAKQVPATPASGLALSDIYYILFRRKWLILTFVVLGLGGATTGYFLWHPDYVSEARLYVAYVDDPAAPDQFGQSAPRVDRGDKIINSELQIITSFDLAKSVAESVGPAKILGDKTMTNVPYYASQAAGVISGGLDAQSPKNSQVIELTFSHPDPAVAQEVLSQYVTNYIIKHSDIHQRTEMFTEYLNQQTVALKNRLTDWGAQIAKLKNGAGVVDMAQAMATFHNQESGILQEYNLTMDQLDGAKARAEALKKLIPAQLATTTNGTAVTNVTPPTPDEQEAYASARSDLVKLQAAETQLESRYTASNPQVQTNLLEIAAAKNKVKALEKQTPGLIVVAANAEAKAPGYAPARMDPVEAYNAELVTIADLQGRVARQTNELALMKDKGDNLVNIESKYHELEMDQQLDEKQLEQSEEKLMKVNMDTDYGPSRVTGISVAEAATPPARDRKKETKVLAGIGGGGIVLGFGLAFLLEMVLDRSLKRPKELAAKLALPYFLTVPYLNGNSRPKLSKPAKQPKLLPPGTELTANAPGAALVPSERRNPIAVWEENHALHPFHETLRDRLISYFEMINLTHKPKLVALTSCHHGAGVSTMAAGLASSLSETGDGNVLLVNMNSDEGDAHQFYKGKPNMDLDDVFEKENREPAHVQENLYVIREASNREKLPAAMPKRFSKLVTKMKASDYDYIIFDMPPVSEISVTPRLARFMDMVLLVVESGKTDRDAAQRASALLSESRANVGLVMNKQRSYVPKRLHQEV